MKKSPELSNHLITIESFGGTEGLVTGSCHRVTIENAFSVLVDCGLYQGKFEERSKRGERRNFEPIKHIAKGVTHVLESHVHIDHTGRLPIIYRDGFTPTILATEATAAFMEPMLYNSAKIQENEHPSNQLYKRHDVEKTLNHVKVVKPFVMIPVGPKNQSKTTTEFLLNGHIMGASSIVLRDHKNKKTILFTGDMGKPEQSLCGGYNDFSYRYPKDPIQTLVIESTNFEKNPVSFEVKQGEFIKSIKDVWAGGGNPLFPVLSLHRSQEIMEMIHNCQESGEIPLDCKIIIDAPLAMEVLDTFKELGPDFLSKRYGNDPEFYPTDERSIGRFDLKRLTVIKEHKESQMTDQLYADYDGKVIILASGGMGNYGRVVNYLHGNFAMNPKNAVILTCFQVSGTEGAGMLHRGKMVNGKREGARVLKIEGFTSHISGPKETFDFLGNFDLSQLNRVIITHGKDTARNAMAEEFKRRGYGAEIVLSRIGQTIEV